MRRSGGSAQPSRRQIDVTRAVVEWYLRRHFGSDDDPGLPQMFMDASRIGRFAIERDAFAAGDPTTLFRLLVATTMFQRRQDQQIMRVLREMPARRAAEVSSARRLLRLVDETACPHGRTITELTTVCDLQKDTVAQRGFCSVEPRRDCHLKRHTVWLRRYGHFGKVPTTLALMLREAGARDLAALRERIVRDATSARAAALSLEAALCHAWRVNQKIASMFLSIVCNPDLPPGAAPWSAGVDWRYFVVVDSNVDLFLSSIGYSGGPSYDARRGFVEDLANAIDLRAWNSDVSSNNPRLVQQAMYLFMSAANRRVARKDCSQEGATACRRCPPALRSRCALASA